MLYRRDRFASSDAAATVRRLTHRLRYFRFVYGAPGMGLEGDRLLVRLRHASGDELYDLQIQLGLTPATLAEPPWSRRLSLKGIDVGVSSSGQFLDLTIAGSGGNPYRVTESDVQVAALIEPRLDALLSRVVDPPEGSVCCISPAEYPELFDREGYALIGGDSFLRHGIDEVDTSGRGSGITRVKIGGRCRAQPAIRSDERYIQEVLDVVLASRPVAVIVDLTRLLCDESEVLAVPLPDVGGRLGPLGIPVAVLVGDGCASAIRKYAFGRSTEIAVEQIEWVYRSPDEALESLRRRTS